MRYGTPCNKLKSFCNLMKTLTRIFILTVGIALLPSCSYFESYFPDKERDYQYTSEIPLLNWPSGLRENKSNDSAKDIPPLSSPETNESIGIEAAPPTTANAADTALTEEQSSAVAPGVASTEVTQADEADVPDTVSSIEIVKYDDGESRLRLGAGFAKSWRVVNKALTHNTIEVTERNHDQGNVTIQYDPDEKKVKDDSFMDEIDFIFKGINVGDKEYNLKFEEHDQKTDVIVLDEEHLPLLNDNASLRLLKLLSDTIKADLVEKGKLESS